MDRKSLTPHSLANGEGEGKDHGRRMLMSVLATLLKPRKRTRMLTAVNIAADHSGMFDTHTSAIEADKQTKNPESNP